MQISIQRLSSDDLVPYDLLLLADPSLSHVKAYVSTGDVYVGTSGSTVIAAYVLSQCTATQSELMNITVEPSMQGQGIGRKMLEHAVQTAAHLGANKIVVGTGNSSLGQLAFYQKCGFRIIGIERDYFVDRYSETIVENGIICRDRVHLERDIQNVS